MNSKEFLLSKLNELFNLYSYLEIKYEYNALIDTHIVEVKPVHCFESDKPYILKQIEIENLFQEYYPFEELLFITENVLIQVTNPILKLGICDSKVNYVEASYIQCVSSIEIINNPVEFKPYYSYITNVIQEFYKSPPKKEINKTKKDSEIISESFFFIILHHD